MTRLQAFLVPAAVALGILGFAAAMLVSFLDVDALRYIAFACAALGVLIMLVTIAAARLRPPGENVRRPSTPSRLAKPMIEASPGDELGRMPRRFKLLGVAGGLIFVIAINLPAYWADHRPRSPDASGGYLHPLTLKGGGRMYVSTVDIGIELALSMAGIVLIAAAILLARRSRRT